MTKLSKTLICGRRVRSACDLGFLATPWEVKIEHGLPRDASPVQNVGDDQWPRPKEPLVDDEARDQVPNNTIFFMITAPVPTAGSFDPAAITCPDPLHRDRFWSAIVRGPAKCYHDKPSRIKTVAIAIQAERLKHAFRNAAIWKQRFERTARGLAAADSSSFRPMARRSRPAGLADP